jgi:hypothetical protein
MILELAWLYVPVAVIAIFWLLEIRPLRHLLHHAPIRAARPPARSGR